MKLATIPYSAKRVALITTFWNYVINIEY
jgi:hypothetical protein